MPVTKQAAFAVEHQTTALFLSRRSSGASITRFSAIKALINLRVPGTKQAAVVAEQIKARFLQKAQNLGLLHCSYPERSRDQSFLQTFFFPPY